MSMQQYCLRWNNHQPNFISVFSSLLNNESLVDVTLSAEGRHLQAHKLVLSACSSYFQSLFTINPCQHPIVILKDVNFVDLKVMIDFMYYGEVNVSQEQLPHILKTAELLKIKGLAEIPVDASVQAKQQQATTTTIGNSTTDRGGQTELLSSTGDNGTATVSSWITSQDNSGLINLRQSISPGIGGGSGSVSCPLSPSSRRKRLRKSSTSTENRPTSLATSLTQTNTTNVSNPLDPSDPTHITSHQSPLHLHLPHHTLPILHPLHHHSNTHHHSSHNQITSIVNNEASHNTAISATTMSPMAATTTGGASGAGSSSTATSSATTVTSIKPDPGGTSSAGVGGYGGGNNGDKYEQLQVQQQPVELLHRVGSHDSGNGGGDSSHSHSPHQITLQIPSQDMNQPSHTIETPTIDIPGSSTSSQPGYHWNLQEHHSPYQQQTQQHYAQTTQASVLNVQQHEIQYTTPISQQQQNIISPKLEVDDLNQQVQQVDQQQINSQLEQQQTNSPPPVVQQQVAQKRKRSVNPQADEKFIRALEAVRFGGIGFCKAARMYGVNNRTLWLEYKKRGYPISRLSIKDRKPETTATSTTNQTQQVVQLETSQSPQSIHEENSNTSSSVDRIQIVSTARSPSNQSPPILLHITPTTPSHLVSASPPLSSTVTSMATMGTKRCRFLKRQSRVKRELDSSSSDPIHPHLYYQHSIEHYERYGDNLTVPHRVERQVSDPLPMSGPVSPPSHGGRMLTVPGSAGILVKQHSHPLLPSQQSRPYHQISSPPMPSQTSNSSHSTQTISTSTGTDSVNTPPVIFIDSLTAPLSSAMTTHHEGGPHALALGATATLRVRTDELKRSASSPAQTSAARSSHCPVVRSGPALGCNYCWNTVDTHGRILRRKTKYHCPECQTNLCIVPCFQEYHERHSSGSGSGSDALTLTQNVMRVFPKTSSM